LEAIPFNCTKNKRKEKKRLLSKFTDYKESLFNAVMLSKRNLEKKTSKVGYS
jgi:hypothetical protein